MKTWLLGYVIVGLQEGVDLRVGLDLQKGVNYQEEPDYRSKQGTAERRERVAHRSSQR
jgi:hypothetical protein